MAFGGPVGPTRSVRGAPRSAAVANVPRSPQLTARGRSATLSSSVGPATNRVIVSFAVAPWQAAHCPKRKPD